MWLDTLKNLSEHLIITRFEYGYGRVAKNVFDTVKTTFRREITMRVMFTVNTIICMRLLFKTAELHV